jgi:hypothetical protein
VGRAASVRECRLVHHGLGAERVGGRLMRDLIVDAAEFDNEGCDRRQWPAWRE